MPVTIRRGLDVYLLARKELEHENVIEVYDCSDLRGDELTPTDVVAQYHFEKSELDAWQQAVTQFLEYLLEYEP